MEIELRPVKGYEGLYSISSDGRVFSHYNGKIEEKTLFEGHNGYLRVALWKEGKGEKFQVHRLVAEAFIPNPDNLETVDHIDSNQKNNHFSNLRWLDREFNSARNKVILTDDQVRYIRQHYRRGKGTELALMFGIDLSALVKAAKGKSYKWVV